MRHNIATCSYPETQEDNGIWKQEGLGRWYRNKIAAGSMAFEGKDYYYIIFLKVFPYYFSTILPFAPSAFNPD